MHYYNEFHAPSAAWLEQLIADKFIPNGHVDSRSILEVQPSDLSGFFQCHFFAGIGGWSLALQLAGWPTNKPVWTGSCPCQPYSSAGKQLGDKDERNLWPAFFKLIAQCRPEHVIGEQVATAIGKGWLDGISADLGAEGYACGSAVLGAHSVGADHIRQRLYWMADAQSSGPKQLQQFASLAGQADGKQQSDSCGILSGGDPNLGMADADHQRRVGIDPLLLGQAPGRHQQDLSQAAGGCEPIRLADSICGGQHRRNQRRLREGGQQVGESEDGPGSPDQLSHGCEDVSGRVVQPGQSGLEGLIGDGDDGDQPRWVGTSAIGPAPETGDFVLLPCRDGKTRRTQPGIFPLVDGLPRGVVHVGDPLCPEYANSTAEARVMRLHGYGNAIHPGLAAEFIQAFMEVTQ